MPVFPNSYGHKVETLKKQISMAQCSSDSLLYQSESTSVMMRILCPSALQQKVDIYIQLTVLSLSLPSHGRSPSQILVVL